MFWKSGVGLLLFTSSAPHLFFNPMQCALPLLWLCSSSTMSLLVPVPWTLFIRFVGLLVAFDIGDPSPHHCLSFACTVHGSFNAPSPSPLCITWQMLGFLMVLSWATLRSCSARHPPGHLCHSRDFGGHLPVQDYAIGKTKIKYFLFPNTKKDLNHDCKWKISGSSSWSQG